jgi:glycosyltransferase involved in cell wall biosynthesis
MIRLLRPKQFLPDEAGKKTNPLLLIASVYEPWHGGIAAYINDLTRGLISLGETARLLAVVQPHERERIQFLETYEPWMIPFQLVHDDKPTYWLGRKCVSLLEILRCLSPDCRRLLERTSLFEASTASIARLERILSTENPTAIVFGHLDTKLYSLALSLLERRKPYGLIAHGPEVGWLPNSKKNEFVKKGVMLRGASWIAANSRHTESLLEKWRIPSERIQVINPPISDEVMRESYFLKPMSRKGDDLNLLTVCRLVRGKGIDIVMRALKILSGRGVPYRYVIGGDGPEQRSLQALADELGLRDKVQFNGYVTGEAKWRLFRNADVFAMPSRADSESEQESFGIAFVEAAAFGVPSVGSRIGGIPEAVLDGETGILVPQDSPLDLANALTFFYRQPEKRQEMGGVARERARRQFSPRIIAARFREEAEKAARQ